MDDDGPDPTKRPSNKKDVNALKIQGKLLAYFPRLKAGRPPQTKKKPPPAVQKNPPPTRSINDGIKQPDNGSDMDDFTLQPTISVLGSNIREWDDISPLNGG